MGFPILGLIGGVVSIFTGKSKTKQAKYQAKVAEELRKKAEAEARARQVEAMALLEKAKGQKTMFIALGVGALGIGLLTAKGRK